MIRHFAFGLVATWLGATLHAWDYAGHRIVNQLALTALPKEFPAFVHGLANAERVAFLAGEPDRWKNVPDLPLRHSGGSWLDHFCDLEYIQEAGLDLDALTPFRYEFTLQFAAGRAAHPEKFPAPDPARNADKTAEWPGFAPWAIAEYFGRLRSGFSYLKVFEELGTPDEIADAQANILYTMGVMGHYVGDCAQPLHTTKHHNGWVGDNPNGYSTQRGIHSWVDGGFIAKAGVTFAALSSRAKVVEPLSLAPRADGRDPIFVAVLDYLRAQHRHVAPLYELDKAGKLGQGDLPITDEARAFIEARLTEGGQMLAALWVTAWRGAVPDTYLRTQLLKRQIGTQPAEVPAAKSTP